MIDLLVYTALAAAGVFVAAWFVSPSLRRWIEEPKYTFQRHLDRSEGTPSRRNAK